jgi:hypothetical protein
MVCEVVYAEHEPPEPAAPGIRSQSKLTGWLRSAPCSYAFASSIKLWFVPKDQAQSAARALHDMSQKIRETHRVEKIAAAVRADDAFSSGKIFLRTHGLLCGTDASTKCCFDVAHKKKGPFPDA